VFVRSNPPVFGDIILFWEQLLWMAAVSQNRPFDKGWHERAIKEIANGVSKCQPTNRTPEEAV